MNHRAVPRVRRRAQLHLRHLIAGVAFRAGPVRTHDWRLRQHSGRRSLVMPLLGYACLAGLINCAGILCCNDDSKGSLSCKLNDDSNYRNGVVS